VAKPIKLGLVLEGEEALKFNKYIENPDFTEDGLKLIREAVRLAKRKPL
jgi:hypothetical protein